jgi:hypothetical protein
MQNEFQKAIDLALENGATSGMRSLERALNSAGYDADVINPNTTEAHIMLARGRVLVLDDDGGFWGRDADGFGCVCDYRLDDAEDAAAWSLREAL